MTMRDNPHTQGSGVAGEDGFTLLELLVVMLILAALAALAVPAFFSQREKGMDASAKAYARTAQSAIESYATENDGRYTGATLAELIDLEPTLTGGALTVGPVGPSSYTVTATSSSGVTYTLERLATGVTVFDCAPRGEAGCPSGTGW